MAVKGHQSELFVESSRMFASGVHKVSYGPRMLWNKAVVLLNRGMKMIGRQAGTRPVSGGN